MIERTVEINGARVAYLDNGGKGPAVICCHGNSSSADSFAKVSARLAGAARVLAIDFYGHGRTPIADPQSCGVHGYARLIAAFTRQLELDAYLLLGHSLGGHAVLESLPALDANLKGAICLSSPPFNRETIGASFRDPTEGLIFRDALTPADATRIATAFAKPESLTAEEQADVLRRIQTTAGAVRTFIGMALAQGAFGDEVEICRAAKVPLTFIQGKEDPFINVDCYRTLPLDGRRDRVVLVDHVRHSPHLEAVETVGEAAARHLLDCR